MPSSKWRANSLPVHGMIGRCWPCRFITLMIQSWGATMSARTRSAAGIARIIGTTRNSRRSHRDIVNEPRLAEPRRGEEADRPVTQRLDAGKRLGMAGLEVIDRKARRLD